MKVFGGIDFRNNMDQAHYISIKQMRVDINYHLNLFKTFYPQLFEEYSLATDTLARLLLKCLLLRVHEKINSHFWMLRRPDGKARKL